MSAATVTRYPLEVVADPAQLAPGDVIEARGGAWWTVVYVQRAPHPLAAIDGGVRVEVESWRECRPFALTLYPDGRVTSPVSDGRARYVGRLEELDPHGAARAYAGA